MNLKNITLKTSELGPVEWKNVEKLQPSDGGFICFVSAESKIRYDEDNKPYTILLGKYIKTDFNYKPTYKELINFIVQKEYPDGKELQLLRRGIYNPNDEEYLDYYNNVEQITNEIKYLLT